MFYAFLINAYNWINFLNIKIIEIFFEEKKIQAWLVDSSYFMFWVLFIWGEKICSFW